jgi:hypothetical protein
MCHLPQGMALDGRGSGAGKCVCEGLRQRRDEWGAREKAVTLPISEDNGRGFSCKILVTHRRDGSEQADSEPDA